MSVVASLASFMAIATILVYLRQTRSTLRGVLRERSMASLASFLSTNSNLALGGGARRVMGTKAAAQARGGRALCPAAARLAALLARG